MTFYQARDYSRTGLHIRRESWTDTWWILWRGLWWFFAGGVTRVVQAADYNTADLLADDWTTVPKALAACPIDSTIGSTGGAPPPPMSGGLSVSPPSADGTPSWLSAGGSLGSAGSSSGPGPVYIPPENDGSLTVDFDITKGDPDGVVDGAEHVGKMRKFQKTGANSWSAHFTDGKLHDFLGNVIPLTWSGNVTRDTTDNTFTVTLSNDQDYGGFTTETPKFRNVEISNFNGTSSGGVWFYGGTAKVL